MRTFTRYTLEDYVKKVLAPLKEVVTFTEVHVHATWKPTIQQFRKDGGLYLMQAMWRVHTGTNGWTDIAQHATIDPDGYIWDGRSLRSPPASSTGHNDSSPDNRHPFMFEMIGNFDKGQEKLEGAQLATAIGLCKAVMAQSSRNSDMVKFHREFTNQKTCPGSGIDKSWFIDLVKKGEPSIQITKERIVEVGGKLKYIPLNSGSPYSTKATDVRFIRIPKGKARFGFTHEKNMKVTQLLKKYKADIGFNAPYINGSAIIGDSEVNDVTISSAYGKSLKWHEFAVVNGQPIIGQLDKRQSQELLFQSAPLLVWDGKNVAKQYAESEEVAPDIVGYKKDGFNKRTQRTFFGVAKNGDFLLAVSDGRTGSDQGLTIDEMALYMIDKGAVTALNGDGGGSTILATSFGGTYVPYGKAFSPGGINQSLNTGINERVVSHAVLIYLL